MRPANQGAGENAIKTTDGSYTLWECQSVNTKMPFPSGGAGPAPDSMNFTWVQVLYWSEVSIHDLD